jgi:Fur family ferric uptake transcriptional regulator
MKDNLLPLEESISKYKGYLERNKMFFTRERDLIINGIYNQEAHFSADELNDEMRRVGSKVSKATLYRCLSQLVDCSVLTEVDFGHGHIHYEVIGTEPHEHLVCQSCGAVQEVASQEIEDSIAKIGKEYGFQVANFRAYITGKCAQCQI